MASNDTFEESAGSSDEDVEGYKYAQLHVPNHEFDASSEAAASSKDGGSGSSFIRLGSFPDFAFSDDAVISKDDSGLVTTSPGRVKSVSSDAPAGFKKSLNLARLVGDKARIDAAEAADDAASASVMEDASTYVGDGDYLLGFADDTRYRQSGEKAFIRESKVDNTTSARKAETGTLLTKSGWWDHSDGNRISTTAGDKVEVIQGNYKMVILGRQSPDEFNIGKVAVTDFSGGHFQEQYSTPTPAIKTVSWVPEDGGWTLFQDNGSGNVTTKFHGKQVDYFTGTYKEAVVGSAPSGTKISSDPSTWNVLQSPTSDDPTLVSRTWAQRIEAYTGSAEKSVPHVLSQMYAGEVQDHKLVGSIVSTTTAASIVSTSAAAAITTVAVAPIALNLAVVGQNLDIKLGQTYTVHDFETKLFLKKIDTGLSKDALYAMQNDLVAAKSEITANFNSICSVATDVGQVRTQVQNTKNDVSTMRTALAAQHILT